MSKTRLTVLRHVGTGESPNLCSEAENRDQFVSITAPSPTNL
jgi:hypothetical protein